MQVLPVEIVAARMTETVAIFAQHRGYKPKPGIYNTDTLHDLIADWVEMNMEPAAAKVLPLHVEKVGA